MIWRRDLRNCAEQRDVFSCRLERGFGTSTVVHTQSMRKQHSFIFKMVAALSVLQIPRVFPRGSCYKSAKEIQSLHPGLKIGSKSQQIPRHARVCPRGHHPPGWPLISALPSGIPWNMLSRRHETRSQALTLASRSSVKGKEYL